MYVLAILHLPSDFLRPAESCVDELEKTEPAGCRNMDACAVRLQESRRQSIIDTISHLILSHQSIGALLISS